MGRLLSSCALKRLALERDMPKSPASVMDAQCPSRLVLDRIADKWTALIIQLLSKKTMRYAELQREIGGVLQKKLAQTPPRPERDGRRERKVLPVGPPKGRYSAPPPRPAV